MRSPLRNPVFAVLFMVAVAVSGGCLASSLMRPETRSHTDVEVALYAQLDGPHIGERIGHIGKPQEVRIRAGMPLNQRRRVIVHELYHVAGWTGHNDSEDCYTYPSQGDWPCTAPCAEEIRQMQRVQRTFTLYVVNPELLPDVLWAVSLWNSVTHREVFRVAGRGP